MSLQQPGVGLADQLDAVVLVPKVLTTRTAGPLLRFKSSCLCIDAAPITWSERRSGKPLRLGVGTVASGEENAPDHAGAFRSMSFGSEKGFVGSQVAFSSGCCRFVVLGNG